MNIIGIMTSINKYGRYFVLLVLLANLMPLGFATTSTCENLATALADLCHSATLFLAAAIIIMIILAGAIYAIGQIMGAETRARASVWATAMLTGAIIAVVIYFLTPIVLNKLLEGSGGVTISTTDPCAFTCTT